MKLLFIACLPRVAKRWNAGITLEAARKKSGSKKIHLEKEMVQLSVSDFDWKENERMSASRVIGGCIGETAENRVDDGKRKRFAVKIFSEIQ